MAHADTRSWVRPLDAPQVPGERGDDGAQPGMVQVREAFRGPLQYQRPKAVALPGPPRERLGVRYEQHRTATGRAHWRSPGGLYSQGLLVFRPFGGLGRPRQRPALRPLVSPPVCPVCHNGAAQVPAGPSRATISSFGAYTAAEMTDNERSKP